MKPPSSGPTSNGNPSRDDLPRASEHWAPNFFGDLYERIYSRHILTADRTREETEFALGELGGCPGMLLDLAAGYGRHARLVARKRAVTALDINLAYLHNARAGLSAGAKARLHATAADMRLLPFAPSSFGGVMMLFNSFGYFPPEATSPAASSHEQPTAPTREVWRLPTVFYERGLAPEGFNVYQSENDATPEKPLVPDEPTDRALNEGEAPDPNLAVLREVARVLRPEGKFLIEAPNPAPLLAAVRRNPRRHLVMERSIIEDDFFFDEGTKVLGNRTRFVDGKDMHHCGYSLRLYTRGELTAALRSCGFVIEQTKGDYTGSAYESRTSPMMLITARRR